MVFRTRPSPLCMQHGRRSGPKPWHRRGKLTSRFRDHGVANLLFKTGVSGIEKLEVQGNQPFANPSPTLGQKPCANRSSTFRQPFANPSPSSSFRGPRHPWRVTGGRFQGGTGSLPPPSCELWRSLAKFGEVWQAQPCSLSPSPEFL